MSADLDSHEDLQRTSDSARRQPAGRGRHVQHRALGVVASGRIAPVPAQSAPAAHAACRPLYGRRFQRAHERQSSTSCISHDAAFLSAVVIPRTSEQEHKLYLYLREVVRQGSERAPEPILYNLLHARSPEAASLRTGTNPRPEDHAGAVDRPAHRTRGALAQPSPKGTPRARRSAGCCCSARVPLRGCPVRKRWR